MDVMEKTVSANLPSNILIKIIKKSSIVDVFLSNSSFELRRHPKEVDPVSSRINIEVSTNTEVAEDRKAFICNINRALACYSEKSPEDSEENLIFKINATFSAVYLLEDDEKSISDSDFKIFAETNADFNTYTYFREFIHSNCARASIPPFVLPFYYPMTPTMINEKYKDRTSSEVVK